jgi:cyclase
MKHIILTWMLFGISCKLLAQPAGLDKVQIKTTQIRDSIYLLQGSGGNIGVFAGEEGVILVDDQFAALSNKIATAVKLISDKPIEFIVNTHLHGDHVGGNENFRNWGVKIVAHDLVRERLLNRSVNRRTGETGRGAPDSALPDITYNGTLTFHSGGETIRVIKMFKAHTDGDSIVHFVSSNVIHAGDVFRTTTYPVIDLNHGGTFQGTLETLAYIIELADDDTIIIPGHGVPSSKKDIIKWRKMLTTIASRIQQSVDTGDKLEEALARNPGLEFNDRWASPQGWASTKTFMTTIYNELSNR